MALYAYNNICIIYAPPKTSAPKAAPHPTGPCRAAFQRLLPSRQVRRLPALKTARFYERLFTPRVTLWYFLFQWLQPDHTLAKAVSHAHAGGADALCRGLSKKLRSTASTSYSDARQRLPLAFLGQSLALQARRLLALNPQGRWHSLVVCLLDGSTVRLRPQGDIPKHFPPNGNQIRANTYWCLMRVVAGFCARTGAALDCACGSFFDSEQSLACQRILRQQAGTCLYLGDRNFGIFRIVQTVRAAASQVLVRLTQRRARRLRGQSLRLGDYPLLWSPTRHDQLQADCPQDPVSGRLLVVRVQRPGFRSQTLYLFTTLTDAVQYPPAELVELYGGRWHIELNLRYLKSQMGLVQLECKSAAMARKEWLAALLAYNLVRAAMLCAALHRQLCPLTLSFSLCSRHLVLWLERFGSGRGTTASWDRLLDLLARARLPRRRKPRPPEPRAQRHLRQPYPPLIGSRAKARRQLKSQKNGKHKS